IGRAVGDAACRGRVFAQVANAMGSPVTAGPRDAAASVGVRQPGSLAKRIRALHAGVRAQAELATVVEEPPGADLLFTILQVTAGKTRAVRRLRDCLAYG